MSALICGSMAYDNIMVFPGGKQAVAQQIAGLGGVVERPDAGKHLVEATLTPEQLFEVAGWDEPQRAPESERSGHG